MESAALADVPATLMRRAEAAAAWLRRQGTGGKTVTVVHHIDADGIAAGAIAMEALRRAGIPGRAMACKSLDDVHLERIHAGGHDALWLCDFGSAAYMRLPAPFIVCDHHELVRDGTEESFPHVNPRLDGVPGDTISGAGCAWLVAYALDARNADLVHLALVGATGDMQERHGGFSGTNALLVAVGVARGSLETATDACWYGTETRPLARFLAYARDPELPGLAGDPGAARRWLDGLGIAPDATQVSWSDLEPAHRQRLMDALLARLAPADRARAWRTVVRIRGEPSGTQFRELQEFATALNSTARYGRPEVGIRACLGDPEARAETLGLLHGHRRNLAKSIGTLKRQGIRRHGGLHWVDAQDCVQDTVVGIVCGMLLDQEGLEHPLVAFAHTEEGGTKVSCRLPRRLHDRIDLASAVRRAAEAVGGIGGGHRGAAGATIPRHRQQEFLTMLDDEVAAQQSVPSPAASGSA